MPSGPSVVPAPAGKPALRRDALARRRARPADQLAADRLAVAAHVLAAQASSGWSCVAAYEPLRTEPGSTELLAQLAARGVMVLVPVTLPDRDLGWREWNGSSALLGLDAIAGAEAIFAPALLVARDGVRLGRGGGSYDRALRRATPTALIAALAFDEEVVDMLPADPWDVPVGAVVTPAGWTALRNTGVDHRNTGVDHPR